MSNGLVSKMGRDYGSQGAANMQETDSQNRRWLWRGCLGISLSCCLVASVFAQQEAVSDGVPAASKLVSVFESVHDGWSLDEVLIRDDLRQRLMEAYLAMGGKLTEAELLEELVSIRKSGRLTAKTTQSNRADTDDVAPAAEIAARRVIEQTKESLDRVFVDPALLKQFDQLAREVVPDVDLYLVRKAALRLRKTRQLRPELLARVTDWKVEIRSKPIREVSENLKDIPDRPGVYIFRDSTGYLYIGQSKDLRDRLTKHLEESDRLALAGYLKSQKDGEVTVELHVFQEGSPAEDTVIREAYESELIRTRKPRLNLAP